MLMIFHFRFSLTITTMPGLRCSIFYLFGLQSPKVFYIFHFPALVLVDVRTICLNIQSQISCTGASVSSCIGFQLGQNMN